MADFKAWSHESLVMFATASQAKLLEQNEQIADLKEQLRVALNECRRLIILKG